MGEIASAYVRIRPNMSGFRSETQAGVRSAFSGVGKIVGVAFGTIAVAGLVKSAVGAAADIQKQIEGVRYEFGRAGAGLIKFADGAGSALGSVNRETDAASVRFGMMFKNLSIGPALAAQMTKGWEQLALATNAIRGGNADAAAQLLQVATRAAATGRGLNQLGIIVDATRQKQAYQALTGQKVVGSLTVQQRAIANYAIMMQSLGGRLQQARAHSHDLADVQAHLTAEWAKAKEKLGSALLPEVNRGVTTFTHWLQRMNRSGRLTRDFATAAHVASVAVHVVGAAIRAGINFWNGFAHAVGGARHALILLAGAFALNKIRKFGSAIRTDVNAALTQTRKKIAAVAAEQKVAAAEQSSAIRSNIQMYTKEGRAAKTYGTTVKTTSAASAAAIRTAAVEGEAASTGLWTSMKVGAITTALTIKSALISTGIGLLMVAIGIAVAYIFTHWDQVKRWTMALGAVMTTIWHGLTGIIIGSAKAIGGAIVAFLIFPMKEFIDVAAKATGWIPYLGDGVSSAAKAVDGLYDSMKRLASDGKNQVIQGARTMGGVGKAWSDSMAKSATDPAQKKKLKDAGKGAAGAFADGFKGGVNDGVAGIAKGLNDALKNVIAQARERIRSSIQQAKDNLVRIGSELAKTIDEIKAKMGGAAGSLAGSPQGKAFAKLKQLIESGAPSFEIARARAALSTQLAGVGKQAKTPAQHQLADLTSAFNQGKITYTQFTNRLHRVLRENGITLAAALKTGGKAFADTYRAQVAALAKQAAAINAVPKSLRGVGGAGGAADIKIVQPLKVIAAEQMKVRLATQKVAAKIAAAEAKAASQRVRQINSLNDLRHGSSHAAKQRTAALQEAKHHTRLLARIAAENRRRAHEHGDDRAAARRLRLGHAPVGPQGPTGVQGLGPHGRRHPNLAAAPAGQQGPMGVQGITNASRAGAASIRAAIQVHRGAVVRAVAGLGARLSANERALLVAELKIAEPLDRLRSDQARIGAHAAQQRDRLIRSSDRTNTLLRRIVKTNVGPLPGYGKQPKGKGSHEARQAATVGSRT